MVKFNVKNEPIRLRNKKMVIVNNRDKIDWHENMTVKDLLDKMNYTYSLITVTVNGQLVPRPDYEEFNIPDSAQVNIFHLAHGG